MVDTSIGGPRDQTPSRRHTADSPHGLHDGTDTTAVTVPRPLIAEPCQGLTEAQRTELGLRTGEPDPLKNPKRCGYLLAQLPATARAGVAALGGTSSGRAVPDRQDLQPVPDMDPVRGQRLPGRALLLPRPQRLGQNQDTCAKAETIARAVLTTAKATR